MSVARRSDYQVAPYEDDELAPRPAAAPGKRTLAMSLSHSAMPRLVQEPVRRGPALDREAMTAAEDAAFLGIPITDPTVMDRIQAKAEGAGLDLESAPTAPVAGGSPLPTPVLEQMQEAFGADFSSVRVSESAAAARMGAQAYTQGESVVFAPGRMSFDTRAGKELLGHELMHVVQQRQGRVSEPRAKSNVVANDALEREADDAGARAARGERISGGGARGVAAGRAIQRKPDPSAEKENIFITNNGKPMDAETGAMKTQVDLIKNFVADVNRHLDAWSSQRGTPNLRFSKGDDMRFAYSQFIRKLAKDPAVPVALDAARRLIDTPRNRQFIQEIRMFANDMLGDYKRLLDIEDIKGAHVYELKPIVNKSASGGAHGAKIGGYARRVKIRYSNTKIKGLTWTQEVGIKGVLGGVGISRGAVKGAKAGEAAKPSGSVSTTPSFSDWKKPQGQPVRYLPPGWFDKADYARGSLAAKLGLGPLGVSAGTADMSMSNMLGAALMKLSWHFPPGTFYSASVGSSSLKPPKAEAELGGTIESGTTSTVGELEFEGGDWDEEKDNKKPGPARWMALHAAQIYFPTGSADLDKADNKTVGQIINAIRERDNQMGYEIFKISVTGCHSRAWKTRDDRMAVLQRKFAEGKIKQKYFDKKMKELQDDKGLDNQALAQKRAENVQRELQTQLNQLHGKVAVNLDPKRRFNAPTTRAPIGEYEDEDLGEDRSVYVIVRYRPTTS